MEEKIAEIICSILNIQEFRKGDDFFSKGGSSYEAMILRQRLKNELGLDISLTDIFSNDDLSSLTAACRKRPSGADDKHMNSLCFRGMLSHEQEGLWLHEKMFPSDYFRLTASLELNGEIDEEKLKCAVKETVQNHDMLRSELRYDADGMPVLRVYDNYVRELQILDWSGMPYINDELINDAVKRTVLSLEMEKIDKNVQFVLMKLPDNRSVLTIGIHHLYSDEISFQIVFDEIIHRYSGDNVEKAVPYTEYISEEHYCTPDSSAEKRRKMLEESSDSLYLKIPYSGEVKQGEFDTWTSELVLGAKEIERLQCLSGENKITLHNLFLGAFKVLLYHLTGSAIISVGIPVNSRADEKYWHTCGLFVNQVLAIDEIRKDERFDSLCRRIQLTMTEQIMSIAFPYEILIRNLKNEKLLQKLPYHIHYNFIDEKTRDKEGQLSAGAIRFEETGHLCDFGMIVEKCGIKMRVALVSNKNFLSQSILDSYAGKFQSILRKLSETGLEQPVSLLCEEHNAGDDEIVSDFSF